MRIAQAGYTEIHLQSIYFIEILLELYYFPLTFQRCEIGGKNKMCFSKKIGPFLHDWKPGPIKCFGASSQQILAKKCLPKRVIATRLILRQKCVNSVKIMWIINNNLGPSTGLPCLFFLTAYIWGLASSLWGGTLRRHIWGTLKKHIWVKSGGTLRRHIWGTLRKHIWGGTFESNLRMFEE